MKDITIDYSAVTVAAEKYGYKPSNRSGFYENAGVVVDLSAAHPDYVHKIIIEQLTAKLSGNGEV